MMTDESRVVCQLGLAASYISRIARGGANTMLFHGFCAIEVRAQPIMLGIGCVETEKACDPSVRDQLEIPD